MGLAELDFSFQGRGRTPDLVICEWSLRPTDAGECVYSSAAAMFAWCVYEAAEARPVAEDSRVTDVWESMQGSVLQGD